INLEHLIIYFELQFLAETLLKNLIAIPAKAVLFIQTDNIGNLARNDIWNHTLNNDFTKFRSIVALTMSFDVDVSLYQNAGASMVQQLAYAMAHATEYLDKISDDEVLYAIFKENNTTTASIIFNVSVGTNYFFEIAKLRALRLLWRTIANTYHVNPECHIVATPSKRTKTIYEANTNLLRTTTECMSAILGGANTIFNMPFDAVYKKSNAFSERMARNQLLILKYESWFNKVNN